jgi:hypothetical protein
MRFGCSMSIAFRLRIPFFPNLSIPIHRPESSRLQAGRSSYNRVLSGAGINRKQKHRAKKRQEKGRRSHENGTASKPAETKPVQAGRPHPPYGHFQLRCDTRGMHWSLMEDY